MTLFGQLGALESAGLLQVARVDPELEYLFRHALVQDAAYASLLDNDRKRLHKVVGETVERLYGERLDEFSAVLSWHFAQAGDDLRALRYAGRAGDAALATYANREAEIHYRRALQLTCPECERVLLLAGLGEALYRLGRFEEALETWRKGIDLYRQIDDFNGVAYLYARSARVAWHAGDQPEGLRLSKAGLDVVSGAPDSSEIAMLIHEAARACHFNGVQEKALHLCKKALQMAERLGAVEVLADALATYGVLPDVPEEEGVRALQKSIELAENSGYLGIALRAYHNLAAQLSGQLDGNHAAREYFLRSAELGRQRGVASEEHFSLMAAVGITLEAGQLDEAQAMIAQMFHLADQMSEPGVARLNTQAVQVNLLWMQGEWEEALRLSRVCQQDARQRGDLQQLISINNNLAAMLLELNLWQAGQAWEEIDAALQEAIELSERGIGKGFWPRVQQLIVTTRQGQFDAAGLQLEQIRLLYQKHANPWFEASLALGETEFYAAEGRFDLALVAVEKAFHLQTKMNSQWGRARTLLDWARVHIQRGELTDLERARALHGEALSAFQAMGARRHAEMVEAIQQQLRSQTYQLALASQADAQELVRAAQLQESFLPERIPQLDGWELVVTLTPARRTSGDFYDFIPLPNNRLAIVVADVADKGAGAALFMTTTRSLLRTFAAEYAMWPELVLAETNRRMLADTHAGLFVTMFYAVLDPASGLLTYCNAGHNPPLWLKAGNGEMLQLKRSGAPLGIFEENTWEQAAIQLAAGDSLVLYTDGVTDALNLQEQNFGEAGLQAALQAHLGAPAGELRDQILRAMRRFTGTAPQFDDITLMVLRRELA